MSLATLGNTRALRARVWIPAWGVGYVDCDLDAEVTHAKGERVTFTIADRTIECAVASGGPADGRSKYRLAFGRGGWGTELGPKSYTDDGRGVKRATIVRDAAVECGESVTGEASTERVGPAWVRDAGLASRVLPARGWYVGLDGLTRLGLRSTSTFTGDAVRINTDRAAGVVELAVESLAGLEPGVIVNGVGPALDVEWELEPSRLTVRCYASPVSSSSERTEALGRIVEGLFPNALRYQGNYEFRIVSQSGERLNLQPVRVSSGMPELPRVPVRLPPGVKATWLPGSTCLVTFVDALPSRPVVVAGSDPDEPGWMPLTLEFGGSDGPALGVMRIGDPVQAGPFSGVGTGGSLRVKAVV